MAKSGRGLCGRASKSNQDTASFFRVTRGYPFSTVAAWEKNSHNGILQECRIAVLNVIIKDFCNRA
jgi:hypothetical protein